MSERRHALWRAVLLSSCALTALLAMAELADVKGLGGRAPWYGLWGATMGAAGPPYMAVVLSIDPGKASDRAGLRTGDLIDVRANDLVERFYILTNSAQPPSGRPIPLSVTRGSEHLHLSVVPLPIDVMRRVDQIIAPLAVLWLTLFASIIAWRRAYVPGNLLLSSVLLLTAIVSGAPSHGFASPWAWTYVVLSVCLSAVPLGVAMWATYASGFSLPLSLPRQIALIACYALVLAAILVDAAFIVGTVTLWFDPVGLSLSAIWMLPKFGAVLAAIACSVLAIADSRGIDRQRAAWSLVPLPFVYLAFLAFFFINFTAPSYATYVLFSYVYSSLTFVAPLALTYAAVNRRLIDIGFVLNRTLVFAIVSAIVVGVFVLVEWAVSEWFVSSSHMSSVVAGMVVALVLGVSMRYIHRHVDRLSTEFSFASATKTKRRYAGSLTKRRTSRIRLACWTGPLNRSAGTRTRTTLRSLRAP